MPVAVNLLLLSLLGAAVWHVGFPVVAIVCWMYAASCGCVALYRRMRPCKA